MSTNCQYCGKNIRRSNLIRHYSSNRCRKTRLEKEKERLAKEREKLVRETEEKAEYITQIKVLQSLLNEKDVRLQEKDARIRYLEEQLAEKNKADQNTLHEIAKQPRTVTKTKNVIQLGEYRDLDKLINENLSSNYILEGIPGLAKCIVDNNTDSKGYPSFLTSDSSRQIIRYRDATNQEIKDKGVTELVKRIKDPVKEKACEISKELIDGFVDTDTPELVHNQMLNTNDLMCLETSENEHKFASELSKRLPVRN